jgi:hypothetical protein
MLVLRVMARNKNKPNMYEILKTAGGEGVLKDVSAEKEYEESSRTALEERPKRPERVGPKFGEKKIVVTYNTFAFLVLVFIGLLLVSYAIGVRYGKTISQPRQIQPSPKEPTNETGPLESAQPRNLYTIKLRELKDTRANLGEINKILDGLSSNNLKNGFSIRKGGSIILCYGKFLDKNSAEATMAMDRIRSYEKQHIRNFPEPTFILIKEER